MKKYRLTFFLLAFSISSVFADDTVLVNCINRQFENIKLSCIPLGVRLNKVVFVTGDNSHVSNSDHNIYLNLKEMHEAVDHESDSFMFSFVNIVLSHEAGHQLQANGFGSSPFLNAAAKQSVFLECDADLLAGLIVARDIYTIETKDPEFNVIRYNLKDSVELFTIFVAIDHMDNKNLLIATHPSTDQRTQAFYAGKTAGGAFFYHSSSVQNSPAALKVSAARYDQEYTTYTNAARGLNYIPVENLQSLISWAHIQAMSIVSGSEALGRNLVRYDTHLAKHPGNGNPVLEYSFKIYNENSIAVRFACIPYTDLIIDDRDTYIFENYPYDAQYIEETIESGKSMQFSGELLYKEGQKIKPKIKLPGSRFSKYWVYAANNPLPDQSQVNKFVSDLQSWNFSSLDNIYDLLNVILSRKKNLFDSAKGIGIAHVSNESEIAGTIRNYTPDFISNNVDNHEITYLENSNTATYMFDAVSANDSAAVHGHFDEITNMIKTKFSFKANPVKYQDGVMWESFFDTNDKKALRVLYESDPDDASYYLVEISVYGTAKPQ